MKFTLQVVSDLHIEYNNDEKVDPLTIITPSADILVLAGDIGSFYKYDQLHDFLSRIVGHFKHVIYVPGNHEYYIPPNHTPLSLKDLDIVKNKIGNSFVNLSLLDRDSLVIGDYCIVGATLWSNIQCELPRFIVRINQMTTAMYKHRFEEDLKYIKKMIHHCTEKNLKMICVTHHPPTENVLYKTSKKREKYKSLYASDLDDILDGEIVKTWMCGHVHRNFDFMSEKGCRVLGNQKGKPKDNITDFKKDLVIQY